jgi:organic hydroperoxide reductase OsmC/OhrA
MSTFTATIRWGRRSDGEFVKGRYSREHEWELDSGTVVPASGSPLNVPEGTADEDGIDPEEALIAALSSCHMLFFIDYARRDGFVVDSYVDEAVGIMEERPDGKVAVTRVTLRPETEFSGDRQPSADEIAQLHHRSHEDCFIANSVRSEVTIEPR